MKLVVTNLAIDRGERRIFSGVNLEVGSGETLVVTGANGAGKSTLLKAIAGFLRPAEGTISLEGGGEGGLREHCHYLAHDNALKPSLSVRENLLFWQEYLGTGEDVETALERIGLGHTIDLPAGFLSAGQKRRIAIARLLVSKRPVWLVDEPTAALDAASEKMFAKLGADHVANGGILVAATHQELGLKDVLRLDMGAHVGRMSQGAATP
ncbi:MAG: heme ABC exporter ATP-binding protein CcmA [Nitratireductor sp.]|nr:heme ABC exporter ATP-binding protein CcmA [Nitratireductor sp.]MCB1460607.1 heme ABC exporter ATP-binding protein CcmA [Nitratireductor sp.]